MQIMHYLKLYWNEIEFEFKGLPLSSSSMNESKSRLFLIDATNFQKGVLVCILLLDVTFLTTILQNRQGLVPGLSTHRLARLKSML